MIDIRINDKSYSLPTSFADMTLGEYCDVFYSLEDTSDIEDMKERFVAIKRNGSKVISRLLKEGDSFCLDLPIPLYEHLENLTSFIYSTDSIEKRNSIKVNGKEYKVPKVREMSLRQWIDIDVISQEKDNRERYIHILGVLLNEVGEDGELIPYKGNYEEMSDSLREVKCSEGLGIVYYFFWRGESLKKISEACLRLKEASRYARHTLSS